MQEFYHHPPPPRVSLLYYGPLRPDLLATISPPRPCPFLASAPQVLAGSIGRSEPFAQPRASLAPPVPSLSLTHTASCIIDLPVEPGWPGLVPRAPVGTAAGPVWTLACSWPPLLLHTVPPWALSPAPSGWAVLLRSRKDWEDRREALVGD